MELRVLATRGIGGYRQYRIPSLAVTKSGRIIALYDGRPDFDDLPSPVDVVMRTSDDNGKTWSEQTILREHHDISGYGDASLLIDPTIGEHGRILMFCQLTRVAGFFESVLGIAEDDPMIAHINLSISDDNGKTWSHRLITDQLKDAKTPGIFATSGAGTRLTSGRLIQTFVLRRENRLIAAIGYSDDHGESWHLGAEIIDGNESAAAETSDGTLLIHSRSRPYRLAARSKDGGLTIDEVKPDLALPDPSDNGSLFRLSDGSLICTHNHDSDLRRNTVIKRSFDNGYTWPDAVILESGSSAYSTAYELVDGSIGVLFEREGYSEIVFTKVQLDEFKPAGKILQGKSEVEFDVILRNIRSIKPEDIGNQNQRRVPEVDMSIFGSAVRKEVGPAGGNASNEPLYTTDELDRLLGPVAPGWHLGDEVRWSGKISNKTEDSLTDIQIRNSFNDEILSREELLPGETWSFLDMREVITSEDLSKAELEILFTAKFKAQNKDLVLVQRKLYDPNTGLPCS